MQITMGIVFLIELLTVSHELLLLKYITNRDIKVNPIILA